MHKYKCLVTPSDELVVYITDVEKPPHDHLVLVVTNEDGHKISTVLTKDDAELLHKQIGQYLQSQ